MRFKIAEKKLTSKSFYTCLYVYGLQRLREVVYNKLRWRHVTLVIHRQTDVELKLNVLWSHVPLSAWFAMSPAMKPPALHSLQSHETNAHSNQTVLIVFQVYTSFAVYIRIQ